MAKMITPNFSVNEMTCKCGCGRHEMDGEFMRMLQTLRDEMQGPLRVSSGFRCEDHNEMVSTTGRTGPHTKARATDILISGERAMVFLVRESPSDWLQRDRIKSEGWIMPIDSYISTLCLVRLYSVTE